MLPKVTRECLESVTQSLLEDNDNSAIRLMEEENPILATAIAKMINTALKADNQQEMVRGFLYTIFTMYKLLHSQDEANTMEQSK